MAIAVDDFDHYLSVDPVLRGDGIFNVTQYPQLALMALDCCAIPLMSDGCERTFSSGRDLITYRRSRLKCDLIEAMELLRQWLGTPARRRMKNGDSEIWVDPLDDEAAIIKDYGGGEVQDGSDSNEILD